MSEKQLWSRIRAKLNHFGHFERVENGVGVGTPDIDFCVHGVEGKIELKYLAHYPVREGTRLLGRNGLRQEQVVWISRRCRHEGRVFVLVGVGTDLYLLRMTAGLAAELNELSRGALVEHLCWFHVGRKAPDYSGLVRALVG
ncbi:MAG: hypothetical protein A2W25_15140 [candidate division Zixibacteria bacterium RBG_16_53_22]|nr:MAG: hypothetical protein A2W25_15140 [candidate division Zixibacteria bacterium RBG_16_53_22]